MRQGGFSVTVACLLAALAAAAAVLPSWPSLDRVSWCKRENTRSSSVTEFELTGGVLSALNCSCVDRGPEASNSPPTHTDPPDGAVAPYYRPVLVDRFCLSGSQLHSQCGGLTIVSRSAAWDGYTFQVMSTRLMLTLW